MGAVTATILSAGKAIDPQWEVVSIDVRHEVDRVPGATLTLVDGNLAERTFPLSDAAFFKPGQEIEIKLRYEDVSGSERSVFKGLIVRHAVEANARTSLLTVELRDKAIRLTRSRKTRVLLDKTDSEAMRALLKDAGVTAGSLPSTQPKHKELVQYHCTDWDFILSRADVHGLRIVVEAGKVSARAPALSGAATHTFDYGASEIYDFEMEADGASQSPGFAATAWDVAGQKPVHAGPAKSFALKQGDLDAAALAQNLGFREESIHHAVPVDQAELKAAIQGCVVRNRLAFLRGRIGAPGLATLKLLDVVELSGLGKKFSGKALVTGLRHRVDASGWRTDVQLGLSPRRFCLEEGILDTPSAGLLPAATGLQIAVVAKIAEDPAKQVRVQIQLAGVEGANGQLWARWTSPDAAKGRGWYFLPEVGDEVLVGFCNGDPRHPVILGSLFSSKNTPPDVFGKPDAKNLKKGIVTRKGTRIAFVDEDKPNVLIETPAGNKVLLDDKAESIQLADQHGNTVTLDKNGIKLKSAKDLQLEAAGNVVVKSSANLELKADGNLTIKGTAVEVQ